jgi:anthranilate phosphoribosyltransferase
MGARVAKHGNRAASSKSGAADVLAALGVNLEADMATLERALAEIGTCFLWAQKHHTAMRHVGPSRVELATRTIFNLLGPLANPAGVKRQLLGVFSPQWLEPLAEVLRDLGSETVWVVHGDGLDEMTTAGITRVAILENDTIRSVEIDACDLGFDRVTMADLRGGDGHHNAAALRTVLTGAKNPYRDITLLNAAASLVIAGKAEALAEGVDMAARSIDNGAALAVLEKLVAVSNAHAKPA